eukprot:TRINITY_DN6812_c0_g1_i1.p1 TRINITY_DN6812_c0_g1~~TRINITY_DN6812_c0_g1_i1.p1  ORF type:complete len:472 (+),score=54.23 TRINITY_DN6812_c0_g1_i1:310-1725(+)
MNIGSIEIMLFLVSFFSFGSSYLEIYLGNDIIDTYDCFTHSHYYSEFEQSEQLPIYIAQDGVDSNDIPDSLADHFVIYDGSIFSSQSLNFWKDTGVMGMIATDEAQYAGRETLLTYIGYKDDGMIVGVMRSQHYDELLDIYETSNQNLSAIVTAQVSDTYIPNLVIYQIAMVVLYVIPLVLGIRKIFYHLTQCHLTIASVLIVSEICAIIIRTLHMCLGPYFQSGLVPARVTLVLLSASWPFSLLSTLLIYLYWSEASAKKLKSSNMNFLARNRKKYLISITLLFATDLSLSLISGFSSLEVLYGLAVVKLVGYLIFSLVVTVLFLRKGIHILQCLEKSNRKTRLRRVTYILLASSLGIGLFFLSILIQLLRYSIQEHVQFSNYHNLVLWSMLYLGSSFSGACQIASVRDARSKSSSGATSGDKTIRMGGTYSGTRSTGNAEPKEITSSSEYSTMYSESTYSAPGTVRSSS